MHNKRFLQLLKFHSSQFNNTPHSPRAIFSLANKVLEPKGESNFDIYFRLLGLGEKAPLRGFKWHLFKLPSYTDVNQKGL